MTNTALEESAREFVQVWAGSTTGVMGQVASVPFPVKITDTATEALPAPSECDAYLVVTAAGAARGEMSFRIPAAVRTAEFICVRIKGDRGVADLLFPAVATRPRLVAKFLQ
jgi:hypothetical protein